MSCPVSLPQRCARRLRDRGERRLRGIQAETEMSHGPSLAGIRNHDRNAG
jgi:hypothetical protein